MVQMGKQHQNSISYITFLLILVAGVVTSISPLVPGGSVESRTPLFGWSLFTFVFFLFAALIDYIDIRTGAREKIKSIRDFVEINASLYAIGIIIFHGIVIMCTYVFEKTS